MNANKRLTTVWFLILSFISTIGLSLAYWASSVLGTSQETSETITIGEGDTISTELTINSTSTGGVLVPEDRANDEGEVESITFTYEVFFISNDDLDRGAEGTEGTLTVSVDTLTFDGETYPNLESLIVVTLPSDQVIIADGESITVDVTISLIEPSTFDDYDILANSTLVITLVFTVTV